MLNFDDKTNKCIVEGTADEFFPDCDKNNMTFKTTRGNVQHKKSSYQNINVSMSPIIFIHAYALTNFSLESKRRSHKIKITHVICFTSF